MREIKISRIYSEKVSQEEVERANKKTKMRYITANTILAVMWGIAFVALMFLFGAAVYRYYLYAIIAGLAAIVCIVAANKVANYIIYGDDIEGRNKK